MDEKMYKKMICTNCSNESCNNVIKILTENELKAGNIKTITSMKCENFICKNKRKRKLDEKKNENSSR